VKKVVLVVVAVAALLFFWRRRTGQGSAEIWRQATDSLR
jgi:hypothetical protein